MRFSYVAFLMAPMARAPTYSTFEDLTHARHFTHDGSEYLAAFNSFAADKEEVLEDGTVRRAFGIYESIDVSRGDGSQFLNTVADRIEAQAAAVAYCASLNLMPADGSEIEATFMESYADQNAEWSFQGVCSLPPNDPRVS